MLCKGSTVARKRYERDVLKFVAAYVVVLFCSVWLLKHDGHEKFFLYFWSVLPAVPIIALIARMGRYLQQETDEYQRLLAMYSILVGTAALLGTVVVNDFVRSFAGVGALPPFSTFVIFCAGMGITQFVQKLGDRRTADE
jgi:peptidoglycan/LPS O-acetylase OafA/YrhL